MTTIAPETVYDMEHQGCPFSRFDDGRIAQRPFGGAGFPRTCYAADRTGHVMLHTLFQQCVKRGITFYNEWQALGLATVDGRCCGLAGMDRITGKVEGCAAGAVMMATGGYGRTFSRSTNAIINTGSGMAIAYWAGVPLLDMEFVQFHPTSLLGTNILMTEGCRGEGGYLLNAEGDRFMFNYVSLEQPELAPRDIVARSIQTEILEGRGFEGDYVQLDLRHLGSETIMERLPGIREICLDFAGLDPIDSPIPIIPAQHYSMGGIDVGVDCVGDLPGLYAAGEAACVSVHGANRLGGNSLLDTVVFGKVGGAKAAEYVSGLEADAAAENAVDEAVAAANAEIDALIESDGDETPATIMAEMRVVMTEQLGIFREADAMRAGHEKMLELRERFKKAKLSYTGRKYNLDLCRALELRGMLDVAEAIAAGAVAREESRGSHSRRDFPERLDDPWLKHTVARHSPEGAQLSYKDVTITKWQPEARKY